MSTCNFMPMECDMPLVVGGLYADYRGKYDEQAFDMYDEDERELLTSDDIQKDCQHMEKRAEEFSDTLDYYEVTVESGYYDGWQFYVHTTEGLDLDPKSRWCIDNDDAHYWFDECRSKVLRKAESERNRIRKWLKKQAEEPKMRELICVCVFDNGEALYKEV